MWLEQREPRDRRLVPFVRLFRVLLFRIRPAVALLRRSARFAPGRWLSLRLWLLLLLLLLLDSLTVRLRGRSSVVAAHLVHPRLQLVNDAQVQVVAGQMRRRGVELVAQRRRQCRRTQITQLQLV